jgi:hypothetical protein
MYDFGDYEPEQAEMLVNEFMGKMREALTETAKNEIEQLRQKNEVLNGTVNRLKQEAIAVKQKARELEEKEKSLEYRFYEKKFSEILEPFMKDIEVYTASHEGHKQDKCSYCDDEGNLVFTAINGQETIRPCKCRDRIYWYEPLLSRLREFTLYKYRNCDGKKFIATGKFDKNNDDDERYFKAEVFMVIDKFSEETLKLRGGYEYKLVFPSKDECQKYCDWLNTEKEKTGKYIIP